MESSIEFMAFLWYGEHQARIILANDHPSPLRMQLNASHSWSLKTLDERFVPPNSSSLQPSAFRSRVLLHVKLLQVLADQLGGQPAVRRLIIYPKEHRIRPTSAFTSALMLRYVSGITTWLVTRLKTITSSLSSRAATTSGMVLMPTTCAPAFLKNRPSAGVSYAGPATHA